MYALCPNCGAQLVDNGQKEILVCPNCRNEVKSRAYDPLFYQKTLQTKEQNGLDEKYKYNFYKTIIAPSRNAISFISLTAITCFLIILVIEIITIIPSVYIVSPNIISASKSPIFFPSPFPPYLLVPDFTISGFVLLGYYLFLVFAIIISFLWVIIKEGKLAVKIFNNSIENNKAPPKDIKNSFFLIPQLFITILFFNIVYIVILYLIGIDVNESTALKDSQFWDLLYGFTRASVYEEVAVRLFLIGIPLLVIESISHKRKALKNYFFGGGFEITRASTILIIFSSFLFGLAHMPGWGIWKIVPTFVAGIAFGYLYLLKGIHTAILLHFAFDYFNIPLEFAKRTGSELTYNSIYGLFFILIALMLIAGLNYFYYYSKKVINFMIDYKSSNFPNFPCPICGNSITFKKGSVRCKNCGFSKNGFRKI